MGCIIEFWRQRKILWNNDKKYLKRVWAKIVDSHFFTRKSNREEMMQKLRIAGKSSVRKILLQPNNRQTPLYSQKERGNVVKSSMIQYRLVLSFKLYEFISASLFKPIFQMNRFEQNLHSDPAWHNQPNTSILLQPNLMIQVVHKQFSSGCYSIVTKLSQ